MRLSRSVVLLLSQSVAMAFLVGCQPAAKPMAPAPPPMVATEDQASQAQIDIKAFAPNAHVARVQQVSTADKLVAVNGLTDKDVKPGDVVSILDLAQKVVANGMVDSIYTAPSGAQSVVVKYDVSSEGGRAPIIGDLVVTQLPTR